MSDTSAHLPVWVRRRDGSQVPFEADRICQSLYASADALGSASPFFIRELTDLILHFLAKEPWDSIPTTLELADHIEKIVRESGQPELARRFAADRTANVETSPVPSCVAVSCADSPERFVGNCLEAYALEKVFTRDVAGAAREGLIHLGNEPSLTALSSLVLETPRFAELPWWLALNDWRGAGGTHWIVESPEWLCTAQMNPALTSHLCERLLALPTLAERNVELHLNIDEPPAWSLAHPARPLFMLDDEEVNQHERANFHDGFLERWKGLQAPRLPTIAWHLSERSFRHETSHRQLHGLIRQAVLDRPVRFVFDRPHTSLALAEGLDRRCPGVLLEVGLNLPMLARRAEIGSDGDALLRKLPSLVRIAVSAAQQKYRFLRSLPEESPLKRQFLLERASAVIAPMGLQTVVRGITGASVTQSPLALDFALQILQSVRHALQSAGRGVNFDLRVDSSMNGQAESLSAGEAAKAPRQQLEIAGKMHARAGAGSAALLLTDEFANDPDAIAELLRWAWSSTSVLRLRLERAKSSLQQGELPI